MGWSQLITHEETVAADSSSQQQHDASAAAGSQQQDSSACTGEAKRAKASAISRKPEIYARVLITSSESNPIRGGL